MISNALRRIAADSNVLLSAVIGKAALRVFSCDRIEVCTTEFNVVELSEYLPLLSPKYGLDPMRIWTQWRMLPVKVFKETYYKTKMAEAGKLLSRRDPDDIHLAALALKEGVPAWSNDRDFEDVRVVKVFSTAELLTALGV
jgi:predicted nucleic acid-binding protein